MRISKHCFCDLFPPKCGPEAQKAQDEAMVSQALVELRVGVCFFVGGYGEVEVM